MAEPPGSRTVKVVGPLIGIGIVAYVVLLMTGNAGTATPLIWLLVITGIVFGRRFKKNRPGLGGGQQTQRTSTFPTSSPASGPPTTAAPAPAGPTFPTPAAAVPAPSAPAPLPSPTPPGPERSPVVVPALDDGSEATAPSPEVVAQVTELKNTGRMVDAIDMLRDATGMELYEASQYIRKL